LEEIIHPLVEGRKLLLLEELRQRWAIPYPRRFFDRFAFDMLVTFARWAFTSPIAAAKRLPMCSDAFFSGSLSRCAAAPVLGPPEGRYLAATLTPGRTRHGDSCAGRRGRALAFWGKIKGKHPAIRHAAVWHTYESV
jgi:hypothetical protein